jgi:hypothetical protein
MPNTINFIFRGYDIPYYPALEINKDYLKNRVILKSLVTILVIL